MLLRSRIRVEMPAAHTRPRPAITLGGAIIPLGLLAELLRDGATIDWHYRSPERTRRRIPIHPAGDAEFIQCRDLLCRFPGCNRKAECADIDHTPPHGDCGATPIPPTARRSAANTTWRRPFAGWRDEQLPNGEVHWTGAHRSPVRDRTHHQAAVPRLGPHHGHTPPLMRGRRHKPAPGLAMPIRSRTREQDREQRIKAERDYNAVQRALGKPSDHRRGRRDKSSASGN